MSKNDKIIASVTIGPMPKDIFGPKPKVTVTYEDGEEETLFEYYPDEISFVESDFIGKTRRDANQLRRDRDVAFLQS